MDRITNPKDSNVCRTMGNKDNTTPTGSDIPDLCFCYKHSIPSELADVPESCLCYKHVIPSEFNFDNPKFHFTDRITNPKDSNVCRTTGNKNNSTPSGSHTPGPYFGYKHAIPSELADVPVSCFCYKHVIPSEFNFDNPKFHFTDIITNPKDSNVCRTTGNKNNPTPSGSNISGSCFCYKHVIPSEFNFDNPKFYYTDRIANPEDSNVYKTMGNNDKTTNPEDSYIYKTMGNNDKTTNPKDSYIYRTMGNNDNSTPAGSNIPSELVDNFLPNLHSKHAIPMGLLNNKHKSKC